MKRSVVLSIALGSLILIMSLGTNAYQHSQVKQAQQQIKQLQETCIKISVLYAEINEAEIAQELAVIDELLASTAIDKRKKNSSTKVGDKSDNLSEV